MGIRTGIGSEHYHHPHTWMFAAWELGFYVYVHIVIEESYTTTSHWLGRGYPGTGLHNSFRCLGSDIMCLAKDSVKIVKIVKNRVKIAYKLQKSRKNCLKSRKNRKNRVKIV